MSGLACSLILRTHSLVSNRHIARNFSDRVRGTVFTVKVAYECVRARASVIQSLSVSSMTPPVRSTELSYARVKIDSRIEAHVGAEWDSILKTSAHNHNHIHILWYNKICLLKSTFPHRLCVSVCAFTHEALRKYKCNMFNLFWRLSKQHGPLIAAAPSVSTWGNRLRNGNICRHAPKQIRRKRFFAHKHTLAYIISNGEADKKPRDRTIPESIHRKPIRSASSRIRATVGGRPIGDTAMTRP